MQDRHLEGVQVVHAARHADRDLQALVPLQRDLVVLQQHPQAVVGAVLQDDGQVVRVARAGAQVHDDVRVPERLDRDALVW